MRHFRIIVRPAKRRQRLGTLLLASIAGIDHGQENMMLQCLCPRAWISGRAFLDQYGFSLVDTEWYMRLDDRPRPEPPPSGDYVIESAHSPASHAPEIAVLHNRAYCEDTSFMPYSSEAMARALSDDVTLWLLRYRGMLIGYCHVELSETEVWIESLVIDPGHQGCGLGRSLATTVLSESIGNVRPTARLQVSDHNRTAMNLYTSLGFRSTSACDRMRAARPAVLAQLDRLE